MWNNLINTNPTLQIQISRIWINVFISNKLVYCLANRAFKKRYMNRNDRSLSQVKQVCSGWQAGNIPTAERALLVSFKPLVFV